MVIIEGIGDRLRQERERLGLSQAGLGEIGGVKRNTQAAYEAEANAPTTLYLAAIDSAGADVWYILSGHRGAAEGVSTEECALLSYYRSLETPERESVLRVAHSLCHYAVDLSNPQPIGPRESNSQH